MRLLYCGGDLGTTGFGTVTRDLLRSLVEIGVDVRLLTFDDSVPHDLPEWLSDRLALVERAGGWMTWDETRRAQERMIERIRPKFTPEGYEDGWAPDAALVVADPASVA